MLLAKSENGETVKPFNGGRAFCPYCRGEVIAKCGDINIWHWAHINDCPSSYESETEWHLRWKSLFDSDCIEIVKDNHRADVITKNGVVIEFQNSTISTEDIIKRESFWGESLIWVINASNFYDRFYSSVNKQDEDYGTFRWRNLRKSWLSSKRPLYLDFREENDRKRLFYGSSYSGKKFHPNNDLFLITSIHEKEFLKEIEVIDKEHWFIDVDGQFKNNKKIVYYWINGTGKWVNRNDFVKTHTRLQLGSKL